MKFWTFSTPSENRHDESWRYIAVIRASTNHENLGHDSSTRALLLRRERLFPEMSFSHLFDNPLLQREWRVRWRDGRALILVGFVALLLALIFGWAYSDFHNGSLARDSFGAPGEALERWALQVWKPLSWAGTLMALVVAPALTASSIAFERERGLLEALQLSPLRPLHLALGKWVSGLAFGLVLWSVSLPVSLLLALLARVPTSEFLMVWAFQWLTLAFAGAVGIGCSAWAVRAHLALRSAYGVLLLWMLSSTVAAFAAGDLAPLTLPGFQASEPLRQWGRTNALMAASELVRDGAPGSARWPTSAAFMMGAGILCLWAAAAGVKRPLETSPLISHRRAKRRDVSSTTASSTTASPVAPGHFEMPFVGALRFDNPVLGREVRGKFRLRLPSIAVLAAEGMLAILVVGFYFYTLWLAFSTASARPTIFWGVAYTGLFVTMMSCGVMGANGFSREREGGTWEGVRLSLLSPREILVGKIGGSLLTALLFSLPVWPLLLSCVRFDAGFAIPARSPHDTITLSQLAATLVVWLGAMLLSTLWGLQIGENSARSSTASGLTLGVGLAVLVVHLIAALVAPNSPGASSGNSLLFATHPFLALAFVIDRGDEAAWMATGLGYGAFALMVSAALSWNVWRSLQQQMIDEKKPRIN